MQIVVHYLQKSNDDFREINEYIKMSSKWAKITLLNKFNSQIAKAQKQSKQQAHIAYDDAFEGCLDGFCIGLDEMGNEMDSLEFANLLQNKQKISFFIGGAYGFSQNFKAKMDKLISLSKMTLAHKVAKFVLLEQIFRALSINANHPYHK